MVHALPPSSTGLPKCPTGIAGLDEITGGGLPSGRPTLVCGTAGCGKTLFALEFLVRGATEFGETGVFMSFEETARELTANVRSLGFDLDELAAENKIAIDHVHIERSEIDETGDYDLEGLFVRLNYAIDRIGAKRVVLDTIEALFAGLSKEDILRGELRRLFRWLKDKGVTAIVTGERGDRQLTRHGIEEYISDCVILLDHRVTEQLSTRRLRIVKYRGSRHGTNEYPFLIDDNGIHIVPITSIALDYPALTERIPTGIARLDTMLGGGYYRGTTVLVSGPAGSGKSSLAAAFIDANCRRGERCLYFALEEAESHVLRNMRSIGFDLAQWTEKGMLRFRAKRPTVYGLEMHLVTIYKEIIEHEPSTVVIDPVSAFLTAGAAVEATAMVMRVVDMLKSRGITAVFTSLVSGDHVYDQSEVGISSLIDTWLLLRNVESNCERNRALYILKSRGMAHSNQVREFALSERGIELLDICVAPDGDVLAGSARLAHQAKERAAEQARQQEGARRQREFERERALVRAQIAALQAQLQASEADFERNMAGDSARTAQLQASEAEMARARWADKDSSGNRE